MAGSHSIAAGGPAPGRCSVLFLLTRMNIGGPARQLLLLERGLPAHLPALLAAGTPPPYEGELTAPDLAVHRVPLVRPVRPVADLQALVAVRRLLRARRPGVLHTHMAKAGAVGRLAALGSRGGPRLAHTFRGHVFEGYFGGAQQQVFVQLERLLARRTDVLVAVSTEIRDELLDLGIGRPGQYEVIRLGLDLEPFLQVAGRSGALRSSIGLDLGPGVPLVGVLGRLVAVNDHLTLPRALADVAGLHPAVVGDGERRVELDAAARELGLGDRVHFTGWWSDVPAALADLDLVVLSSRNEGTPAALIEALAAGRPVVATDVGGVARWSRTGRPAGPAPPATRARWRRRSNRSSPTPARRRPVRGRAGRGWSSASAPPAWWPTTSPSTRTFWGARPRPGARERPGASCDTRSGSGARRATELGSAAPPVPICGPGAGRPPRGAPGSDRRGPRGSVELAEPTTLCPRDT